MKREGWGVKGGPGESGSLRILKGKRRTVRRVTAPVPAHTLRPVLLPLPFPLEATAPAVSARNHGGYRSSVCMCVYFRRGCSCWHYRVINSWRSTKFFQPSNTKCCMVNTNNVIILFIIFTNVFMAIQIYNERKHYQNLLFFTPALKKQKKT